LWWILPTSAKFHKEISGFERNSDHSIAPYWVAANQRSRDLKEELIPTIRKAGFLGRVSDLVVVESQAF